MFKNVASKVALFAFDTTSGAPKTGDAANLTAYVSKDWGAVTVLTDTSATEMDATNAKGWYLFDVAQAETNADVLLFTGKSSTANITVVGMRVDTTPNLFNSLAVDSSGRVVLQPTQTGVTIPTVTNLTNAPSDSSGVTTLLSRIAEALTITLGKVDVNDKTGFSLSSAGVQAIWDALTSALTTVGSIGKKLADWVVGNVTAIDGNATSGGNAILNLRKIALTPQSGENAINITVPSQSPGDGNRVPAAIKVVGGEATGGNESGGHGIELIGGSCNGFGTGGNGIISTGGNATANAGDGVKGVGGTGAGAGSGISGVGAVASVSGNVLGTLFGRVLGLEATNTVFYGTTTSTTATLFDVSSLSGDNAIKGCRVAHFNAAGKLVQTRIITGYVHATQVITVDEAWSTNPIDFDGCRIYWPFGETEVKSKIVAALNDDTYAEPGQDTPPATATLVRKIGQLYKQAINKMTQDASTLKVYNNAGSTVDQKASISDDGTTTTRGGVTSGP